MSAGYNASGRDMDITAAGNLLVTGSDATQSFIAELDVTTNPSAPSWNWYTISLGRDAGSGIVEGPEGAILVTGGTRDELKITRLEDTNPATPEPEIVWQSSLAHTDYMEQNAFGVGCRNGCRRQCLRRRHI